MQTEFQSNLGPILTMPTILLGWNNEYITSHALNSNGVLEMGAGYFKMEAYLWLSGEVMEGGGGQLGLKKSE